MLSQHRVPNGIHKQIESKQVVLSQKCYNQLMAKHMGEVTVPKLFISNSE
jgi:hypothetical protein